MRNFACELYAKNGAHMSANWRLCAPPPIARWLSFNHMPHCGAPWNFTRLFAKITKCDRLPLKFCMRFLRTAGSAFPSCLPVSVRGFPLSSLSTLLLFYPFRPVCLSVRLFASLTCYACKSLWQIHRPGFNPADGSDMQNIFA